MLTRQMLGLVVCGLLLLSSCAQSDSEAPTNNAEAPSDTAGDVVPKTTGNEIEPADQPTESQMPEADSSKNTEQVADSAQPQTSQPSGPIAVGDQAPEFRLKDQDGQEHSLADLLKQGNLALVFYGSADW